MARHAGLDAARTVATILVVATHAALSFMVTPIGWAIQDRSRHLGVDLYVWAMRAFGMPVFFWLSGYSARAVFVRRGARGFVADRGTRILVPLALALVPCSLAIDALWDWGREVGQRAAVPDHIPRFQGSELPIQLGHLWYLYYLLWLSLAALAVARIVRGMRAPSGSAVLVVPATISIAALVYLRTLQTDTPLGFLPDVPILLYMGAFFAWGWLVHARPDEIARYADHAWRALAVAVALLAILVVALYRGGEPPLHAVVASGLYTIAMVVVFLGLHVRYLSRPGPLLGVASDFAYWTYIVHLPIVVGLQILVASLAIPGVVKYCAILVVTLTICIASYHVVVRRRWSASRSSALHR
ncbi:MAG: acyltransferase [Deltaproteobacteria bacterium]|nr:MAG: acyltransferase [Deltaproteobacteria bacterium]